MKNFPTTLKVNFIPRDFSFGTYHNPYDCPMALALKRSYKLYGNKYWVVGPYYVSIKTFGGRTLRTYEIKKVKVAGFNFSCFDSNIWQQTKSIVLRTPKNVARFELKEIKEKYQINLV